MALKSAFRASLTVNGAVVGHEQWDGYSGGKWTQSEVKYVPYDGIQRIFVGRKETENITLEANYEGIVHKSILDNVGGPADIRGQKAVVTVLEAVPQSNPLTYQQNRAPYEGLVLEIHGPDGDSNDASTVEKITIIVAVGSLVIG